MRVEALNGGIDRHHLIVIPAKAGIQLHLQAPEAGS
jgi:hypothetical protein